jgi:anti-sigma B factor antagonist
LLFHARRIGNALMQSSRSVDPDATVPGGPVNRGTMPAAQPQNLTVHRHDTPTSALVTLVGGIDADSVPLLCASLEGRLHDGVRTIDVDLVPVTHCGIGGIDALLGASQHAVAAGVSLRLHSPPPLLAGPFELTGTGCRVEGYFAAAPIPASLGSHL